MNLHKQITDIPVNPDSTISNIKITPVNVILPQKLPHRNDNVWISSPVKVASQ
jgi:hypothetical protein